ncbi:MAG: glycosyltransferase, partial [Propionibacteriales bacterium]|nr:glycosyltransferase [Propionibacteriales bacterium]
MVATGAEPSHPARTPTVIQTPTVVVCAYTTDRWPDLAEAVGEARRQALQMAGEVVLVIDHNDQLLARASTDLAGGGVTVVPNRHGQGLSGARNTGVEEATGDVVVFLDDDATPRTGWLEALMAPFADATGRNDPTVLGVGGVAIPRWPAGGRPASLPAEHYHLGEFDWVVGCSYRGMSAGTAPIRNLMGCSMAIRRDVFAAVGGFAESLGRVGSTPLGCEETELCLRATADRPEARFWFTPDAVVDHTVTTSRTTWGYFWSRCWAEGLSKAAVASLAGSRAALSTEQSYLVRVLPRGLARESTRLLRGPRRTRGLAGTVAIATGVFVTAGGYLRGCLGRIRLTADTGDVALAIVDEHRP